MNITTNDVTLDCNGYMINGSTDGTGIWAEDVVRIHIKNCTLNNWGNGGDESGIYFNQVGNSTIKDINASDGNRYGIRLESDSNYNNITGITGNSNSQNGISTQNADSNIFSNMTGD